MSAKWKNRLLILAGVLGTAAGATQVVAPFLGPWGVAAFAVGSGLALLAANVKTAASGQVPAYEDLRKTADAAKTAAELLAGKK